MVLLLSSVFTVCFSQRISQNQEQFLALLRQPITDEAGVEGQIPEGPIPQGGASGGPQVQRGAGDQIVISVSPEDKEAIERVSDYDFVGFFCFIESCKLFTASTTNLIAVAPFTRLLETSVSIAADFFYRF